MVLLRIPSFRFVLLKYKIKNSWDKGAGDDGFYPMYADHFDPFLQVTYRELEIKPEKKGIVHE